MAMGVPCIASNIDGPAEIIKQNKNGKLFESENVDLLTNMIQDTIENFEHMKKEAISKCEEVKNKYNISNMCKVLVMEYNRK